MSIAMAVKLGLMEVIAMQLDWDKLVEERNAWVAHNFPDPDGSRTPLDSILGCIEELGELTHHHLKQVQSIRGTNEEHEIGGKDAVGDLSVYLLGVMSFYDVRPILAPYRLVRDPDLCLRKLAGAVGTLADGAQFYRSHAQYCVNAVVDFLGDYCHARGWDYEQIVQETWDEVKKRDWIRYPHSGLPELVVDEQD